VVENPAALRTATDSLQAARNRSITLAMEDLDGRPGAVFRASRNSAGGSRPEMDTTALNDFGAVMAKVMATIAPCEYPTT